MIGLLLIDSIFLWLIFGLGCAAVAAWLWECFLDRKIRERDEEMRRHIMERFDD